MVAIRNILITTIVLSCSSFAGDKEIKVVDRGNWSFNTIDTAKSADPTKLKFFKYYESMPQQVTLPIFENKNLSGLAGKRLYVGYGLTDPKNKNCRIFNTTNGTKKICLPWWRIEREYQIPAETREGFINSLPLNYPPKAVTVCKTWESREYISGGKVTCVSYYDKGVSANCDSNPLQPECFRDTCSNDIKSNCTLTGVLSGETTTLKGVYANADNTPEARDRYFDLKTYQYDCPGGYLPQQNCLEEISGLMYPFECKAPTTANRRDGEYVYCDKERPIYDGAGGIIGFPGRCSDGREIQCTFNSFNYSRKRCVEPVFEAVTSKSGVKIEQTANFHDYEVDVNDDNDPYASNPRCLNMSKVTKGEGTYPSLPSKFSYRIKKNAGKKTRGKRLQAQVDVTNGTYEGQFLPPGIYQEVNYPSGKGCVAIRAQHHHKVEGYGQVDPPGRECGPGRRYGGGYRSDSGRPTEAYKTVTTFKWKGGPAEFKCDDFCFLRNINDQCLEGDLYIGNNTCQRIVQNKRYRCYDEFPADNPPPGCVKTDEQLTASVTDWTGKTVFTKKINYYHCEKVENRAIGCKKYEIIDEKGNLSFATNVAYESKDFTDQFTQALATANMLEQIPHIWSGWKGKCQYGTFFDSKFDLSFFMSMAMNMYSAAARGYFGNELASTINDAQRSLGTNINQVFGFGDGHTWLGDKLIENAANNAAAAANLGSTSFWSQVAANASDPLNYLGTAATLISMALPASREETQAAWNYQQAWVGASTNDVAAQAYASCMASINLSFANMISYSAGEDANQTGQIIQEPWQNPLRISWDDWYGLQTITGSSPNSFTAQNYLVKETDNIGITLIAKNATAYAQLGQVMCAGYKIASQINNLNTYASQVNKQSQSNNGNQGSALAMTAIRQALQIMGPPWNMIGNVVLTFASSFSSGNACEDEKFAMSRGAIQWKTYKFNKQGQCHFIRKKCAKKLIIGGCITRQKDFCCYDQVITRIFVESAKEQLGKSWDNCSDITIADLKNIGFRRCRPGETPSVHKCMNNNLYQELKQAIITQVSKGIPIDSIEDQVRNSMALPREY